MQEARSSTPFTEDSLLRKKSLECGEKINHRDSPLSPQKDVKYAVKMINFHRLSPHLLQNQRQSSTLMYLGENVYLHIYVGKIPMEMKILRRNFSTLNTGNSELYTASHTRFHKH